jgi:hypothetical protein
MSGSGSRSRHTRFLRRAGTGTVGTSEVALICGVCRATVVRWIDRGYVAGFRAPGPSSRSRHRRVRIVDLLTFLDVHMPHRSPYLVRLLALRQAQYGSILDGEPIIIEDDVP